MPQIPTELQIVHKSFQMDKACHTNGATAQIVQQTKTVWKNSERQSQSPDGRPPKWFQQLKGASRPM